MHQRELKLVALSNLMAVWALVFFGFALRASCSAASGLYSLISNYIPYSCYTDLYTMWAGRGLYLHLFPYIFGTFTPPSSLGNGAVEYPVFTGLAMWLTALPASNFSAFFLVSTIVAGILASAVAVTLVYLVGRWAYVWSLSPLLLLYASYNWDIYPVLATILGLAVMLRGPVGWSARRRGVVASVFFGIGCLFKFYPLMFVFPLAVWLALRYEGTIRERVVEALRPVGVALAVVVAGNLPFALFGFDGWLASFQFQGYRAVSGNTMSIWYWWTFFIHGGDGYDGDSLPVITVISSIAILLGFAVAFWAGWRRYRGGGEFPWIGISGAMTVAYMLLGKVDSPQYGLWLLPFLVLLAVPLRLICAYFVADLLLYTGWFHPPFLADLPWDTIVTPVLVTLNAVALVALFISFLRVPVRPLVEFDAEAPFLSRFGPLRDSVGVAR